MDEQLQQYREEQARRFAHEHGHAGRVLEDRPLTGASTTDLTSPMTTETPIPTPSTPTTEWRQCRQLESDLELARRIYETELREVTDNHQRRATQEELDEVLARHLQRLEEAGIADSVGETILSEESMDSYDAHKDEPMEEIVTPGAAELQRLHAREREGGVQTTQEGSDGTPVVTMEEHVDPHTGVRTRVQTQVHRGPHGEASILSRTVTNSGEDTSSRETETSSSFPGASWLSGSRLWQWFTGVQAPTVSSSDLQPSIERRTALSTHDRPRSPTSPTRTTSIRFGPTSLFMEDSMDPLDDQVSQLIPEHALFRRFFEVHRSFGHNRPLLFPFNTLPTGFEFAFESGLGPGFYFPSGMIPGIGQEPHTIRILNRQTGQTEEFPNTYEGLLAMSERLGYGKPQGATEQEIDNLPTFPYKPNASLAKTNPSSTQERKPSVSTDSISSPLQNMDGDQCVICLVSFQTRDELLLLPACAHRFHSQCIREWLKLNRSCPVCRVDIQGSERN